MDEKPWLAWYGDAPLSLDYPSLSLYETVMRTVRRAPDAPALDFFGYRATYRELGAAIDRGAGALSALGLAAGDRITISLPTCPQAVIAVYAAVKLGAVPCMIHPLSTPPEIERYLNLSGSRFAVTLDALYVPLAEAAAGTRLETLVLTRISDPLPAWQRPFLRLRGGRVPRVPRDPRVRRWAELMAGEQPGSGPVPVDADGLALVLYSGGTTGEPKAIMLSHRNVVAEAMEITAWTKLGQRDVVLVPLPIFHGFCLGALVHAPLMAGARLLLMPRFSAKRAARLIRSARPTLLAGVPTLFEALVREPRVRKADLSCLRAAFSGADTLQPMLKERFDRLVAERGGHAQLLEGYGLTEAVTAIMATPLSAYREGTIGVPLPDVLAKICRPGTDEALAPGSEGEICICGPSVMLGYLDDPEATAATLRRHGDDRTWLHTGDLGRMDGDGFFYLGGRLARMIKSSGFNVYPAQVEAVLGEHPAVAQACVVGLPDELQGERVKAFVMLAPGRHGSPELAEELIAHCRSRLIRWSCPRELEFRPGLPLTRFGKVDYIALVREERLAASTSAGTSSGRSR